jgi:hypothetical protein
MLKPYLPGPSQPAFRDGAVLGYPCDERGFSDADVHSHTEFLFRRLKYFTDLLQTGYRHALRPDPLPRSLRAERIALGIDVPELDTVPLWSARRDDGAVSVPFIDFILVQIKETLEALLDGAGMPPRVRDGLRACQRDLGEVLDLIDPTARTRQSVPLLRDLYLPEAFLDDLCAPGGLLERQQELCGALLPAGTRVAGH